MKSWESKTSREGILIEIAHWTESQEKEKEIKQSDFCSISEREP